MAPSVPELFDRLRSGDSSALDQLVTTLYDELRRIAARQLRSERPGHTLQTTALVHEAYLKMAGDQRRPFADRAHFLAVSAQVMRHVLVDHARARAAKKRSSDGHADWTASIGAEDRQGLDPVQLLDLDAALESLVSEDPTLARLIEMRYFGGMTAEETAEVLGQSVHVVRHDLRLAQAWLLRRLSR